MNKGMKKLLEKYGHMIEKVHREWNDGEDYWIDLKDGYICKPMECSCIHEYTLKECERMLKQTVTVEEYEKEMEEWKSMK